MEKIKADIKRFLVYKSHHPYLHVFEKRDEDDIGEFWVGSQSRNDVLEEILSERCSIEGRFFVLNESESCARILIPEYKNCKIQLFGGVPPVVPYDGRIYIELTPDNVPLPDVLRNIIEEQEYELIECRRCKGNAF